MIRSRPARAVPAATNRKARRKADKAASAASGPTPPPPAARSLPQAIAGRLLEADALVRLGRKDEAIDIAHSVVAAHPGAAIARNVLGQILVMEGRHRAAYPHLKHAAALEPAIAQYWHDLGRCLQALEQDAAALIAHSRATALRPRDPDYLMRLGDAYSRTGHYAAAIAAFEQTISLQPDSAAAFFKKGSQLQYLGDFDGAAAAFGEALRLCPDMVEAELRLVQIGKPLPDEDAAIAKFERLFDTPDANDEIQSRSLFTLARLQERRKNYDDAFRAYAAANRTLTRKWPYGRAENDQLIAELIEGFSPRTFANLRGAGLESDRPVFVVGMPRSGTTLVETIVARHPDVFAGGEIMKMPQIVGELITTVSETLRYPRDAARMAPDRLSEIGRLYLSHIDSLAPPEAKKVTDKLPGNYLHLGLIAVLFPNAGIIHCQRDPIDTCLSCFFQTFEAPGAIRISNDLGDLGFHYRLYRRIMDHWHAVLPVEILDVDYENVVRDQETETRRILDFIGLNWHDSCLEHHETDGAIRTSSSWQARQPVYTSSVEKWRRYERHLGPLIDALAGKA